MVGLTLVFIVVLVFKEREVEKNEVVELGLVEWRFCFRKKLKFKNYFQFGFWVNVGKGQRNVFFKFMFISIRS